MAALSAALLADRMNAEPVLSTLTLPVKASTIIYGGATVVTDSSGYAVGATEATGLKCWGVAEETVDNSAGSNGAQFVKVRPGVFSRDVGTSADALTQADIGKTVYAIDDHTVGKTTNSSARSPAGIFLGYDTDSKPRFLINWQVTAALT
jgi:hypothetical protein